MKFVIPSYQRSQQLIKKTLTYLENQGVANEDVFIFVRVDDDDLQNYYLGDGNLHILLFYGDRI